MPLLLAILALTGCGPKGPMALAPNVAGPVVNGSLQFSAQGMLNIQPGIGIELVTAIDLTNTGTGPIRVDLSRSRISVDGMPYQRCRYGQDADPALLMANLAPGAAGTVSVTCKDVGRPVDTIDLKFAASGTGADGTVIAGFMGLGARP